VQFRFSQARHLIAFNGLDRLARHNQRINSMIA
jgi:hypothetical protein